MKNKQCVELIFKLLAGEPDTKESSKQWEEEEQNAVKYIYQILKDFFESSQSTAVREQAITMGLLSNILERLSLVSKEEKRRKQT